ncbi:hypothetical protein I4F81_008744 [Pyropia yezoensis]|uniref:Uncharacterized protein n=1 Tax=Pyropia yezoensis TaxID=2788 RepID=A0ACC3C7D2_PYRYE|nr:hypothetical protein I4F81_008744 [Neopyropia yezoensis]
MASDGTTPTQEPPSPDCLLQDEEAMDGTFPSWDDLWALDDDTWSTNDEDACFAYDLGFYITRDPVGVPPCGDYCTSESEDDDKASSVALAPPLSPPAPTEGRRGLNDDDGSRHGGGSSSRAGIGYDSPIAGPPDDTAAAVTSCPAPVASAAEQQARYNYLFNCVPPISSPAEAVAARGWWPGRLTGGTLVSLQQIWAGQWWSPGFAVDVGDSNAPSEGDTTLADGEEEDAAARVHREWWSRTDGAADEPTSPPSVHEEGGLTAGAAATTWVARCGPCLAIMPSLPAIGRWKRRRGGCVGHGGRAWRRWRRRRARLL